MCKTFKESNYYAFLGCFYEIILLSGGNAKEADRGYSSVGRFIRRGADKAVIRVSLCNAPPPSRPYLEGWKKSDFGKRIIFHREIGAGGNNLLQLRSEVDNRVKSGGEFFLLMCL